MSSPTELVPMRNVEVRLHRDFAIGTTHPRLFGAFVEHLGRCVYGGIFEPGHGTADAKGFRKDVLALVRELAPTVMRYPGGNFVSGYNWEDGVGPVAERPRRLDLAWMSTETNQFGTNEFIDWCRAADTEPMLAVNLGTRGADAARNMVEYCNHPAGTTLSDLRRKHGWEKPHDVKFWCLGNEMDGPWQMEAKTATEYGRIAHEAAKMMKWVDRTLELAACGSSGRRMPTFGQWEQTVLEHTFDHVEFISLHTYLNNYAGDTAAFLASSDLMDSFIDEVVAIADACISLLNHADRVKAACLAQLVNAIAPIMTENGGPTWRQTIFFPFAHISRFGRGKVLRAQVESETYESSYYDPRGAEELSFPVPNVPYLKMSAVADESGGLSLFLLNRDLTQEMEVSLDARSFGRLTVGEALELRHDNLKATNTRDAAECVKPAPLKGVTVEGGHIRATLQPASWNVVRLSAS